jgi:sigma-B regulation protein RsbU (phosphoserine phosphatase)
MGSDISARDLVEATAIITTYALVGIVAFGAGIRIRGRGRTPTLLLSWAMLQHALDQASVGPVARAFGEPSPVLAWAGQVTGYFIAVPWALIFERMLGRGWHSAIRVTAIAFILSGAGCTLVDIVSGTRGFSAGFNRVVVVAGAGVAFAHLFAMKRTIAAHLTVVRVGILTFMALVVHDGMVESGLLPWKAKSGPWPVLLGVGSIGYTVIAETMRRRNELHAVEQELATARRIQSSLLPSAAPTLCGTAVGFRYVPAAAVAGDVFDFMDATSQRAGILIADVSGHGVAAALIASMVKVAAAAQRAHADEPARVLAGIHGALAEELPPAHFVTAIYAQLDLERGTLRYASAGHPPPIIWNAAQKTILPDRVNGPMIISIAPPTYPVHELPVAAGDRVLLYTDGVVEAMRADDEMFGMDRLREVVATAADGPGRLAADVIDAAAAFTGRREAGFEDDCTVVAIEIGPNR